jgi:hypothetical protein
MTAIVELHTDVGPAQRIDELWVWIGTHPNGGEGILSVDLPAGDTGAPRHMPLMSSKRELAEVAMAGLARRIQREAMHRQDRLVKIELRHFVRAP